ncbi:MAG: lipid-A-disaccharide synthase-related protein [Deinococcales bacterium]
MSGASPRPPVDRLVIVSNGHGEDVIGAAIARALRSLAPRLDVRALPLVDDGAPYRVQDVPLLMQGLRMPSGGVTLHSFTDLVADLRAGFLGLTTRQAVRLARLSCDVLLVVGDVYAQALAALARPRLRAVLQPLVSIRHWSPRPQLNRYFMERISYPERVLMRHLAAVVYARDEATAAWLRRNGVRQALALGNPVVDVIAGRPLVGLPPGPVVALLPGTRAHTPAALTRMAAALTRMPGVTGLVAWHGGTLPDLPGWAPVPERPVVTGLTRVLASGDSRLWIVQGRFSDVLASARVALGTAGTGNEQAAASGLPVVSFPLEPHYARAFVANQERLLGAGLTVTDGSPEAIAASAQRLLADGPERRRAVRDGMDRMGPAGGAERIARDLLARAGRLAAGPDARA